jgi:hypothetical protein
VANDEMPRGAVSKPRSEDVRMGEPSSGNTLLSMHEYIVHEKAYPGN